MNIELPREYEYKTKKTGEIVAYVEEGILKLKTITYFREIMRDISYKIKGTDICGYCYKSQYQNYQKRENNFYQFRHQKSTTRIINIFHF